jgi:hypothetical protein
VVSLSLHFTAKRVAYKLRLIAALCVKSMSNNTLVRRMETALSRYLQKEISRKELISSVEENGRALEMMPYNLIKEIDEIEHQLTVSQWAEEDGFLPEEEQVLVQLRQWLQKIPKEPE